MKTRLYFLWIIITICGFAISCKKMDSTFDQYVVPGGITYPGKAKSAVVRSGNNRATLTWLRGTDPLVVKARIFWNNFTDSVEVDIPANQDQLSYTFTDLEEDFYSFTIITYDAKGNTSVPVEVSGNVYGDRYQNRILSRPVSLAALNNSNELSIQWTNADTLLGAFATEVEYTNLAGERKIKRFRARELSSEILDYKPSTSFKYRSLYLPDSLAIDTFYTEYLVNEKFVLDKSEWTIAGFDNQHGGDENRVVNIIDGDPGTRWHGLVGGGGYPHYFTVNMGATRIINQLGLWRMRDDVRAPDRIQILTSMDNVTFTDQGTFAFNRQINDEQIFNLQMLTEAKYFRVVGLSGPESYIVLGEVTVYVK